MLLIVTAASIGFFHTLTGPDHYLPFIVMAKAGRWSKRKTLGVTILCGAGHVASSIILGAIGIVLGIAVGKLEIFEGMRGSLAGWALILFGLGYMLWGMYRVYRKREHKHIHVHQSGEVHSHSHKHEGSHGHTHSANMTPWILFLIFVLGPCEPLIPILMYPAAESSIWGVAIVSLVFAVVTILTMLAVVMLSLSGVNLVPAGKLQKYMHPLAGAAIFLSGVSIQFLGL